MKNFTKLLTWLSEQPTKVFLLVSLMLTVFGMNTASAQIAQRGTATTSTTTGTTLTITKPTGVVSGDVMLVNIAKGGNDTNAPTLTGWTLISGMNLGGSTNRYGAVLYKVAGGSEPSNYAFALGSGTNSASGGIVAFSGVDVAGGIFDVASGAIGLGNSASVVATGKTTITANTAIIMFGQAAGDNPTWGTAGGPWNTTSPGALLELFDIGQGSGDQSSAGAAWALKPTAGATGNGTVTLSASERNGSILIALKKLCPLPTITTTGTVTSICASGSNQTTTLAYTATTNTPTSYTIDWNAAANTAGLADQTSTSFAFAAGGGTINTIAVTGGAAVGSYTGTMTITTAGGCSATQAVSLVITGPTVSVGSGLTAICQGGTSAALGGSFGGTATGAIWSDNGAGGTFNPDATTMNATWTPLSTYSGSATLTLTTTGGSCGTTSAAKTQVVAAAPLANAGQASQTICFGSTASPIGASSANGTISWSENGAGSITSGGSTLTPIYTPAAGDVGNTVTLTMSVATAGCTTATSTCTITVNPIATVDAGATQIICATTPNVTLAGVRGGSATSSTWSGGTGTFSDDTLLNAVYTPSAAEFLAGGNVTLTLTTNDPDGPCNAVSDTMIITIRLSPIASAGGTATICPGATHQVTGASSSNGTISWSENGAGNITAGGTGLTPTYTSVAGDAGNTVTLTMTVTNSPCSVATATYTIVVSPAAPAAPGTITGSSSVCAGATSLSYSIAAVANATNYTWTVPAGWNITDGQGSTAITVTAGGAGTGTVTVVASNSCGSTSPSTTVDINPVNVTNGTGYTTSSTKTDGNMIVANQSSPIRRGYVKFPLTALPAGATVTAAILTFQHNGTNDEGTSNNSITALGNNDPTTASASTLYSVINSGTSYSSAIWAHPEATTVTLNTTARTDIQNRIATGYIAMGLLRATVGSAVYNFYGRAAGANAPELAVTYSAPRSLAVTANPTSTTGSLTASACDTYTWAENGQTYTESGIYTHTVGCNTATLDLTITPSTTNGSVTTSACGSYDWAANGQTYTTTGIYTHVVGCNTATLDITITPNTTDGSLTASACDTYTWAENGTTYTESGVYTHVVGCNTATLNLTVTPSTTNGDLTASACDSYTWAANGQTYNATGVYTYVDGCNTATLDLTITPSTTTGSLTTSVCDTYTWAENGATYTESGVYTHIVGCNTATLDLTITPSTTNGSATIAACDSYTWAANGQTYNTTGIYTHVVGCNTATLDLTVTPSTTNGSSTETACISYTWAENGETYTESGIYMHTVGCNTAILNLTVNTAPQTFYADTDGDGFGSGAAILSCTGQPENTSVNNTDCAPADATKWRTGNFFIDADGDTYNNGFPAMPICYGAMVPAGYVAVNFGTDCDDALSTANPNASEILANGIDDNCDGTIDEITPTSYLTNSSCGITLTNLSHNLFAYDLANFRNELGTIQGYRFRVTDGVNVRIYDTSVNRFNLPNMNFPGGVAYATVYTVEVSAKSGGHFRAYGPPCTVTTPAVPAGTYITNPISGSTLSDISNTIFCRMVPSASGYRFRVRNGETVVGTVESHTNRFSLVNLGISNVAFGTTYTIDVLLKFGSQFRPDSEYGPTALITTPATPGTSRIISPSCGSTINSFWTTIYAQQVIGAQGYKFVVTNDAQTREYIAPHARFSLRNLPGGGAANTTYTIRVDVLYNSSYVEGTTTCDITTLPTASRQTNVALDVYEVKAYPNPYADTFKLNINTSGEGQISLSVYDMLGREVESRQTTVDAVTNLEIGSQYPSGVYNVIVTQGDHVKTLRVIKR